MAQQAEQPVLLAQTSAGDEPNPYLLGVYAPIHTEIEAEELQVIGKIPDDLTGVYLRNGPNPRYQPDGRYHWFDGDGMVHAVHFAEGKARYRNRWGCGRRRSRPNRQRARRCGPG